MRLLFLTLTAASLAASPALAAATAWQDVAPGARLRLISSDVRNADGSTLVGLELDMPLADKTYWRLPGETGIPTQLDISGSTGLADPVIAWPYPTPEVTSGFLDYVYHGPLVLPVVLQAEDSGARLVAAVTMGICSEVCVPVRASFALPLSFTTADAGESIRLQQAAALAPIAWTGATPPFGQVSYDAGTQALVVPLADPSVDPASVLASTGDATVIFDTPQKSPDGRSILLPLRARDSDTAWASAPVELTFMTAKGSYEVRVTVAAH